MYKKCADTCFGKNHAGLYFMTFPKAGLVSVTVFYVRLIIRVGFKGEVHSDIELVLIEGEKREKRISTSLSKKG